MKSIGERVPVGEAREQTCVLAMTRLFKSLMDLSPKVQQMLEPREAALLLQSYFLALEQLHKLGTRQPKKDLGMLLYIIPEDRRQVRRERGEQRPSCRAPCAPRTAPAAALRFPASPPRTPPPRPPAPPPPCRTPTPSRSSWACSCPSCCTCQSLTSTCTACALTR